VIVQLERAAGLARDDGRETRVGKLATLLAPTAEAGDISLLVELLSLPGGDRFAPLELSPQRKKERTFAALLRQLEGVARTQPVLMIFEDLHWIDPTSREFLDLVLARIDRLPVLLVATFRYEFEPPWVGQPHVTVMALNRLRRSDGAAMVQQLAGNAALLPQDMIAEIVERTDGVPLFVEEMTRAVLEAGAERGRETAASVPAASLGVPATLQASLMARLDRLGPAAKRVAQIGAAIGREFSYELAAAVGEFAEERFQEALQRLVDAGLVFQRGMPPTAEYMFKHALVQDAAYGTLLRGPRRQLHARIAEALEAYSPEMMDSQPELFAQHFFMPRPGLLKNPLPAGARPASGPPLARQWQKRPRNCKRGWTSWRCCPTRLNENDRNSNFVVRSARSCKPSKATRRRKQVGPTPGLENCGSSWVLHRSSSRSLLGSRSITPSSANWTWRCAWMRV
jgi:predicted ATPase